MIVRIIEPKKENVTEKIRVCAYARVSSESLTQEFAGIYADERISATNTKKRNQFKKMIADCRLGNIDMIITKSISRFERNTLDCLNYVRELKELGIGIIFEKENINTLDDMAWLRQVANNQ